MKFVFFIALLLVAGSVQKDQPMPLATSAQVPGAAAREDAFAGSKAGDECEIAGVRLCWCPSGRFIMGSPPDEPERRPGEDQVEVTLTKGFWMGKYEVTQGQWKQVMGKQPGELTAELPEGDELPVGNDN